MRGVPTAADAMEILGAVYDVERPTDSWLSGVLQTLSLTLDPNAGVAGVLYDISSGDQVRIDDHSALAAPAGWEEAGLASHHDVRFTAQIIAGYRSHRCATMLEFADPQLLRSFRRSYSDLHGIRDQILINGLDYSGKGCAFYLFFQRSIALSGTSRDLLTRLTAHIATAYRLQQRIASKGHDAPVGVDAVLTPSGRIGHAELNAKSSEARQDLTLAVRQREGARTSARRDAEQALKSLQGLVNGRWTLVDHYDRDGTRYVLAYENAPEQVRPRRLSHREQQVVALAISGYANKVIAYELGIANSTVRVLMARAAAKLGATTRSELVARQQAAAAR